MVNIVHAETGPSPSPSRRVSLEELGLVDSPRSDAFSSLTRIACSSLGASIALVTIVDDARDRQVFVGQHGLPEPWASQGQIPLSHALCLIVRDTNAPLIVEDARTHPELRTHPACTEFDCAAYLGMPVLDTYGRALGAFCVIDPIARQWSEGEIALVRELAHAATSEILLRAALQSRKTLMQSLQSAHADLQRYTAMRESITLAFLAPDLPADERFRALLRAGCEALRMSTGVLARADGDSAEILFRHGGTGQPERRETGTAGSFSARVLGGQELLCIQDAGRSGRGTLRDLSGTFPMSYIAAPLIVEDICFGVIEFSHRDRRSIPWTEEEISTVSLIAMFACTHLGLLSDRRLAASAAAARRADPTPSRPVLRSIAP